jgi:hypothetical protein
MMMPNTFLPRPPEAGDFYISERRNGVLLYGLQAHPLAFDDVPQADATLRDFLVEDDAQDAMVWLHCWDQPGDLIPHEVFSEKEGR